MILLASFFARLRRSLLTGLLISAVWVACVANAQNLTLADQFRLLTPEHRWQLVDSVPLRFNAHHTQGMVKVGDDFYMTSVEVSRWPRRYPAKEGKFDRDTGEGVGHLFKFSRQGELLEDRMLGEGSIYHPGGIDFDGQFFWVPVCEYRPFGASLVYRLDIKTLRPEKLFSFDDALGALAFDRQSRTLIGANWGSRGLYKWGVDQHGVVTAEQPEFFTNPSFYVDYQQCYDAGKGMILCSGLRNYPSGPKQEVYRLGGLDLIRVADLRPEHQLPVALWSASGRVMTSNPSWLEVTESGIRAYFVPDDDHRAVLYVYDLTIDR